MRTKKTSFWVAEQAKKSVWNALDMLTQGQVLPRVPGGKADYFLSAAYHLRKAADAAETASARAKEPDDD